MLPEILPVGNSNMVYGLALIIVAALFTAYLDAILSKKWIVAPLTIISFIVSITGAFLLFGMMYVCSWRTDITWTDVTLLIGNEEIGIIGYFLMVMGIFSFLLMYDICLKFQKEIKTPLIITATSMLLILGVFTYSFASATVPHPVVIQENQTYIYDVPTRYDPKYLVNKSIKEHNYDKDFKNIFNTNYLYDVTDVKILDRRLEGETPPEWLVEIIRTTVVVDDMVTTTEHIRPEFRAFLPINCSYNCTVEVTFDVYENREIKRYETWGVWD